jgi:hypothetical protein
MSTLSQVAQATCFESQSEGSVDADRDSSCGGQARAVLAKSRSTVALSRRQIEVQAFKPGFPIPDHFGVTPMDPNESGSSSEYTR